MKAILMLRNTPDRDTGLLPAQLLLGRMLRDTLPLKPAFLRFKDIHWGGSPVHSMWRNMWDKQEDMLRVSFAKNVEKLEESGHPLAKLEVGDHVRIQNQGGNYPNKLGKKQCGSGSVAA